MALFLPSMMYQDLWTLHIREASSSEGGTLSLDKHAHIALFGADRKLVPYTHSIISWSMTLLPQE